MVGQTSRVRTTAAMGVAAGLAVLLGAPVWPATGQGAESPAADTSGDTGTVEFDGRLHANPETGCVELPPDDWTSPGVVPIEPRDTPDTGALTERVDELVEGRRFLHLPGDVYVHAEPWPACDEPPPTTPVQGGHGKADG